jgi:hypothetical protein
MGNSGNKQWEAAHARPAHDLDLLIGHSQSVHETSLTYRTD